LRLRICRCCGVELSETRRRLDGKSGAARVEVGSVRSVDWRVRPSTPVAGVSRITARSKCVGQRHNRSPGFEVPGLSADRPGEQALDAHVTLDLLVDPVGEIAVQSRDAGLNCMPDLVGDGFRRVGEYRVPSELRGPRHDLELTLGVVLALHFVDIGVAAAIGRPICARHRANGDQHGEAGHESNPNSREPPTAESLVHAPTTSKRLYPNCPIRNDLERTSGRRRQ